MALSATIGGVGTLYLVATPIGNLEDITLRALRVLRQVHLIAAEDTRRTAKLLRHFEIETPLVSYHEHSGEGREEQILAALARGDVALVSDAGTPGLSDPGFELVRRALDAGFAVVPVPGPTAVIAALSASGLPTDRFLFLGFLPRRAAERRRALREAARFEGTLIFFEAPHRLRATLDDLAQVFGPDQPMAVARELTKLHEEILRGQVAQMQAHFAEHAPRGEFTLMVQGGEGAARWDEAEVREALEREMARGLAPSEAARAVAEASGWPRRAVYRLTLEGR
jgi:16S rRNA (cytidine1402-2'-O)-methyltransferase